MDTWSLVPKNGLLSGLMAFDMAGDPREITPVEMVVFHDAETVDELCRLFREYLLRLRAGGPAMEDLMAAAAETQAQNWP